jgi:hypothetical protein
MSADAATDSLEDSAFDVATMAAAAPVDDYAEENAEHDDIDLVSSNGDLSEEA